MKKLLKKELNVHVLTLLKFLSVCHPRALLIMLYIYISFNIRTVLIGKENKLTLQYSLGPAFCVLRYNSCMCLVIDVFLLAYLSLYSHVLDYALCSIPFTSGYFLFLF